MRTQQLIWASLLLLFAGVPALYSQDDGSEILSDPLELAKSDDQTPTAYRGGWDAGYKNGYTVGKNDHASGLEFHPKKSPEYKGYRESYDSSMGKRSHYKEGYREGFRLGYQDGFSGVVSSRITPPAPEQSQAITEETEEIVEETPESATAAPPEPPAQPAPQSLPKTASALPLIGMIGLAGIALSFLFRALRREGV